MKTIFAAVIISLGVTACSNVKVKSSTEEAVKYNDQVVDLINPYFDAQTTFDESFGLDSMPTIEAHKNLVSVISDIRTKLNGLAAFDEETVMKDAAITYMDSLLAIANSDYALAMKVQRNPAYHVGEQEEVAKLDDQLVGALKNGDARAEKASKAFDDKQDAWAKEYKFTIER